MKAYVVTLGCPKNLVDSEATLSVLRSAGCGVTDDPGDADVMLVGACSFLEASWRETVEEVQRLARFKNNGRSRRLVLMGCLPRHREEDLEATLPDVDHFLPTGAHDRLPGLLASWRGGAPAARTVDAAGSDRFAAFDGRELLTPSHTAYVKVGEGCNRGCTFCAIPLIRGRQVTRPVREIVAEVEGLVARGVREVTLLSQDIVSYRSGGDRLFELLDAIAATGVDWIRLLYVHPAGLDVAYIERLFSHRAVCRYLEMPVQHAADRILDGMKRGSTRESMRALVRGARNAFPDLVIRSEVIVGFPGETEDDFALLKDFIAEMEFDSLGIFPYSREPGTEAASFGGALPSGTIHSRVEELASLQEAIAFAARSRFIDRRVPVIVDRAVDEDESAGGCDWAGRFYGQALEVDGEVLLEGEGLEPGRIVVARITDADACDLRGVVES